MFADRENTEILMLQIQKLIIVHYRKYFVIFIAGVAYGPNFIKILYLRPQNFFGLVFL